LRCSRDERKRALAPAPVSFDGGGQRHYFAEITQPDTSSDPQSTKSS
jgi:hypothetical protein